MCLIAGEAFRIDYAKSGGRGVSDKDPRLNSSVITPSMNHLHIITRIYRIDASGRTIRAMQRDEFIGEIVCKRKIISDSDFCLIMKVFVRMQKYSSKNSQRFYQIYNLTTFFSYHNFCKIYYLWKKWRALDLNPRFTKLNLLFRPLSKNNK